MEIIPVISVIRNYFTVNIISCNLIPDLLADVDI